jgi:hypothetical protein
MVANCWPIIMLLSAEFLVHARNIRNSNGLIGHIAVDSRGLQEAKSIIEDFEHLIHAQTHLQHHRHHRPGPVRKSIISRAHAIRHSASLLEAHNSSQHEKSFTLAWNELADLTSEEYSSFLKSRPQTIGTRSRDSQEANANTSTSSSSSEADKSIPQNWNWIEIENGKYLTPIKNQVSPSLKNVLKLSNLIAVILKRGHVVVAGLLHLCPLLRVVLPFNKRNQRSL